MYFPSVLVRKSSISSDVEVLNLKQNNFASVHVCTHMHNVKRAYFIANPVHCTLVFTVSLQYLHVQNQQSNSINFLYMCMNAKPSLTSFN